MLSQNLAEVVCIIGFPFSSSSVVPIKQIYLWLGTTVALATSSILVPVVVSVKESTLI